jgi:hypothetical protein
MNVNDLALFGFMRGDYQIKILKLANVITSRIPFLMHNQKYN